MASILALKEALQPKVKEIMKANYNHELFQIMFSLPYLKNELLDRKGIMHRQTASNWLKKLANADILKQKKIGRSTYYLNFRLLEILSTG